MKKFLTALVTAAMLISTMAIGMGAKSESKWLISKGAEIVCPAEVTKTYTEMTSDVFDTNLSGYNYLHFKISFAENFHVEYPGRWGYIQLVNNEESIGNYEGGTDVVAYNIAETKDYEAGKWYDFTIPFSSFTKYSANGVTIDQWTQSAKCMRVVFVAPDNEAITIKDIYISVNENDAAPADEPVSPPTGSFFNAAMVTLLVSSAGAAAIIRKKR